MRIIVTGGTGFIGRALVEVLLKNGHSVTVLSPKRYQRKSASAAVSCLHQLESYLSRHMVNSIQRC